MLRYLIVFALLFMAFPVYCQDSEIVATDITRIDGKEYDTFMSNKLSRYDHFRLLDSLCEEDQIDSAAYHFEFIPLQELSTEEQLFIIHRIASSYWYLGYTDSTFYPKTYEWVRKGKTIADSSILKPSKVLADTFTLLGQYYYRYRINPDTSLYYLSKAHEMYTEILNTDDIFLQRSFMALGDYYRWGSQEYNAAERYFKEALRILESSKHKDNMQLMTFNWYRLASTYRIKKDYAAGISFYIRSLDSVYNLPKESEKRYLMHNHHIGLANAYRDDQQYVLAEKYYKIVRDKYPDDPLNNFNFADCKENQGLYREAMELCQIALSGLNPNDNDYLNNKAECYRILGNAYTGMGEYTEAYSSYQNSLLFFDKQYYGRKNSEKMFVLNKLGEIENILGDYEKAINYCQIALINGSISFDNENLYKNPPADSVINPAAFIYPLETKAKALKSKYIESGNLQLLIASQDCLLLCDTLIERSLQSFLVEDSKLLLKKGVDEIYSQAVENAYELFSINRNDKYIDNAILLFNRNKYQSLLDRLMSTNAYIEANVPDSLVKLNQDLQTKRIGLMKKRNEGAPNPQLQKSIAKTTIQLDSIKEIFEHQYPLFFEKKFSGESVGYHEMQDSIRVGKTMIIQYFCTKESIYVIQLDGEEVIFRAIPYNDLLISNLKTFQASFGEKETGLQNYKDFTKSAYYLYKTLIERQIKGSRKRDIASVVIVPDGELARINFESLITSPADSTKINYKNLDYLIHDFNISYSFSTDILYYDIVKKDDRRNKSKILALSYGSNTGDPGLGSLNWANKEIRSISRKFSGKYFINEKATKENFISYSPNYEVLHLALHGRSDSGSTDSTMLIFRNPTIESGIDKLYAHELYNLQLNAGLVVLSSCETASGATLTGEGIYSMARAFFYAGCPFIVSTLWSLDDEVSSSIMSRFYKNVRQNKNSSLSLREAKIGYIENVSLQYEAHPKYWASFIAQGKTSEIVIKKNNSTLIVYGSAILLILFVILILRYWKDGFNRIAC